ncbi:MAG: ROK family protein [Armatimonadetes bacterium]|nr:ROK family protein [Armatimonadota bacterium]
MDTTDFEGCVGVDIGGQSIKVGMFREEQLRIIDLDTPAEYATARGAILGAVRELAGGTPRGLGVGSPGPLNWRTGVMEWTPNIPWRDVAYTELGSALGCPVRVDNDANVAGLAEAVLGVGRGHHVVSGFTLGTGIGFFTVIGGHVYHGRLDVEGGHQVLNPSPDAPLCGCGAHGCLEAYASASAIEARTGKRPEEIDDPEFWKEIAGYLAWGITNINVLVCPDVVVLAGGMTKRGAVLMDPLRHRVQEMSCVLPPPPVEVAELGARAGVYGAIVLAARGHGE